MLNNVITITKKELKSYFNSPIAYIVVIVFLIFMSVWLLYITNFFKQGTADLRGFFNIIPIVFIIIIPAITMRIWAEEKKMGTDELLLTLPMKEGEIVIGKFLASFLLLVIMIVLTLPLPITLNVFGDFEWGQIIGQYLGVLLLGTAGICIGLFISSISLNQIVAFIFGLVVLLFLTLIDYLNQLLTIPLFFSELIKSISINSHFSSFARGIIDSRDVLYFVLMSTFFLYLNIKTLIFKKWK